MLLTQICHASKRFREKKIQHQGTIEACGLSVYIGRVGTRSAAWASCSGEVKTRVPIHIRKFGPTPTALTEAEYPLGHVRSADYYTKLKTTCL